MCRTFLLWFDKHSDVEPNPEEFLTDPASVVGEQQVDDRELNQTVATLHARD